MSLLSIAAALLAAIFLLFLIGVNFDVPVDAVLEGSDDHP